MDTLTSMKVFTVFVESQSFGDTARRLQISRAMVTRHIQFLERRIGAQLITRTSRQMNVTKIGAAYFDCCMDFLESVAEIEASALSLATLPRGSLRIAVAPNFGHAEIWPLANDFMKEYPDIRVGIVLTNRAVDMVGEDIDVAIRIGIGIEVSSLISRRIATSHMVLSAAPSYLGRRGIPQSPHCLANHSNLNCINGGQARKHWEFMRGHERVLVPVESPIQSNDVRVLYAAALAGNGIVRQPSFSVWPQLLDGSMRRILSDWSIGELAISIVFPSKRLLPAKTRKFIDYVVARFPGPTQRDIWLERVAGGMNTTGYASMSVAQP